MRKISFIKFVLIGFAIFISSCVNGDVTEKVDFTYSFCDGNSKVWMINSVYRGKDFIESRNDLTAKVFVFYNSGKFIYGNLVDLYNKEFEKGSYVLESKENYFEMNFRNKKWTFLFEFVDENHLVLRPEKKSDSDLTFELIPIPEPI
jgi:hypothetical protein